MNLSCRQALAQAESAKAVNLSYRPSSAYAGAAKWLETNGYLTLGTSGGFWINQRGERELAAQRVSR